MADKNKVITAIEPHTMTVPKMDRPSIAFAWFLETMVIDSDGVMLWLTCSLCGERFCVVEGGDTLRVLLNTALAHGCKE